MVPIYSFCKKITIGGALNAKLAIQPPKSLFYRVVETQVWLTELFTSATKGQSTKKQLLKSHFRLLKFSLWAAGVLSGQNDF